MRICYTGTSVVCRVGCYGKGITWPSSRVRTRRGAVRGCILTPSIVLRVSAMTEAGYCAGPIHYQVCCYGGSGYAATACLVLRESMLLPGGKEEAVRVLIRAIKGREGGREGGSVREGIAEANRTVTAVIGQLR
eukprot:3076641-Rhodomonas_salina.1